MSNEIGRLEVLLEAQTASFTKGMDAAIKQIQKMDESVKANGATMNKVSAQFKSVGEAATMLSRGLAVLGGLGYIKSLADAADAANDLADAFGTSISNIYAYQTALLAAGGKTEGFEKTLQKLASNMDDAFEGSEQARNGFERLGISLDQIKNKSVSQTFDMVAVALAKIEDPAKRNAVAVETLGKSALGVDWAKYANDIEGVKKSYEGLEDPLKRAADASDALTLATKKFGTYVLGTIGGIPEVFAKVKQGLYDIVSIFKGDLTAEESILFSEMEKLEKQTLKAGEQVQVLDRSIKALKGTSDPFTTWTESLKKSTIEADLFTKKIEYLDALMVKATTSNEIKVIQTELEKLNGKSMFESWKDSVDKASEAYAMLIPQLEYLADLRNLDMLSIEEYNKEIEKLGFGATKASDDMTKLGDSIAQSIGQNANNAVNTFIDNIGEAKFSFNDFATSVVKDLAKVAMQMLIMQPLIKSMQAYFGGTPLPTGGKSVDGGSTYSLAPVTGIDSRALSGEATASVMGASLASIARANLQSQVKSMGSLASSYQARPRESSSETPLVVNIQNTMSGEAKVTAAESTNADGVKSLKILIEREVKDLFGSGQMDKSMRSAYGLNRAAV